MMQYKGYYAHVEYQDEDEIFHGEVIDTRDVITFQGKSTKELKKAFKDSVDDYLAFCEERGEEPDKPFSGRFNVRIPGELHKTITLYARVEGKSLNSFITDALYKSVKRKHL
jgi:predicted HicB family RNase H-like nuclease